MSVYTNNIFSIYLYCITLGMVYTLNLNIQFFSVDDVSQSGDSGPSLMTGMLGRRSHTAYSITSVLSDMPAGEAREPARAIK